MFSLNSEDQRTRDMYGRHSCGQSTLLARRLVEGGSTFGTVHPSGWDHHWDFEPSYTRLLPIVDSLVYGMFADLLRIDPRLQLLDPSGQPVNVLEAPTAIQALL